MQHLRLEDLSLDVILCDMGCILPGMDYLYFLSPECGPDQVYETEHYCLHRAGYSGLVAYFKLSCGILATSTFILTEGLRASTSEIKATDGYAPHKYVLILSGLLSLHDAHILRPRIPASAELRLCMPIEYPPCAKPQSINS